VHHEHMAAAVAASPSASSYGAPTSHSRAANSAQRRLRSSRERGIVAYRFISTMLKERRKAYETALLEGGLKRIGSGTGAVPMGRCRGRALRGPGAREVAQRIATSDRQAEVDRR
jgi:hypothetical protein